MEPGALGTHFNDRPTPFERFDEETAALVGMPDVPLALRYFGGAGLAHMQKYGTELETFAKIRAKASRHAANNPLALFRKEVTADEVHGVADADPGRDDAAHGVPAHLRRGGGRPRVGGHSRAGTGSHKRVWIAAQTMTTDTPSTFDAHDMMRLVGYDMARAGAQQTYAAAGIGPEDVDVVELHDCFAHNELLTYEALGLCAEGGARTLRRGRRQHLWRQGRDQSVGRPAVERTSAGRDRPRAMLRAHAAAARHGRRAPGRGRAHRRCSTTSAWAAPA